MPTTLLHRAPHRLYLRCSDTEHNLLILELAAGQIVDFSWRTSTPGSIYYTPEGELTERKSLLFLTKGFALLHGADTSIPVAPEYGRIGFGIAGFGATKLEAIEPSTYVCFSPYTHEAHEMFKIDAMAITEAKSFSPSDGLYLCIIEGEVNVAGASYKVGSRIDINDTITVEPASERCQVVLVSRR